MSPRLIKTGYGDSAVSAVKIIRIPFFSLLSVVISVKLMVKFFFGRILIQRGLL